ncbi:protection of telomeres protein 1-like [Watersipora subatra]|uniref:protection of telomeres protein 1-like n=1 Tax=Watersipora subatra TaxID=2589382 RepID=UPI00355C095D
MKRARYEYTYTSLENIPSCGFSQVHIYGVVKYATPIYMASRGTSYYTTVSLHNESLHNTKSRFTISIFADQAKELPACKVGQILRLNRVKLDKFNGSILGKVQMFYGGSWLLFDRESSIMHWDSSSQPHPCWQNSEADIASVLYIVRTFLVFNG